MHAATGANVFALNVGLLVLGLALLAPIQGAFWDAIVNPVNIAALIVRGRGGLLPNIARVGGQLAGALGGCALAIALVPQQHQGQFVHMAGSLRDGVAMSSGFAVEAALVMMINLLFMFLLEGGEQRSPALARLGPHVTAVLCCLVGSEFTGPSLNPAFSFAWNRVYQQHSVVQHVAVFWGGPLTGAVLSALLWRSFSAASSSSSSAAVGPPTRSSRDRAAGRAAALALSSRPKAA